MGWIDPYGDVHLGPPPTGQRGLPPLEEVARRELARRAGERRTFPSEETRAFFRMLFDERDSPDAHPAARWTVDALRHPRRSAA